MTVEFWINVAAAVVIIGAGAIFPPAGVILGGIYATTELASAASGKDIFSKRELSTTERWTRGLLAPLDLVGGGKAAKSLAGTASKATKGAVTGNKLDNAAIDAVKSSQTTKQTPKVKELIETTTKHASSRMRSLSRSFTNTKDVIKNRLGEEAIKAAQKGDEAISRMLNMFPQQNLAGNNGMALASPVQFNKLEEGTRRVVDGAGLSGKGTGNIHRSEIDEVIKKDYDSHGNLVNRSIVPKGYDSVEDFLKVVDDATIKEFGYDSIEEFKAVVGHVDDYLNASPKNNIVNKGLAGGKHVKGVDYDVLGFPIFKGDDVKFSMKLEKNLFKATDDTQFKECTKLLKEAIDQGKLSKELFTPKQLRDIENGEARIKGLTWHHHQVPGKMQLVISKTHKVNHLGGNKLWGDGIR